jgi:hypothetical protein
MPVRSWNGNAWPRTRKRVVPPSQAEEAVSEAGQLPRSRLVTLALRTDSFPTASAVSGPLLTGPAILREAMIVYQTIVGGGNLMLEIGIAASPVNYENQAMSAARQYRPIHEIANTATFGISPIGSGWLPDFGTAGVGSYRHRLGYLVSDTQFYPVFAIHNQNVGSLILMELVLTIVEAVPREMIPQLL